MVKVDSFNSVTLIKIEIEENNAEISKENHDFNHKVNKLDDLCYLISKNAKIFISNWSHVKDILLKIKIETPKNVQVITDFDRTLSSYLSPNGNLSPTTYQYLLSINDHIYHMSQKEQDLHTKYIGIEFDKHLTQDAKIPHMIEWWSAANDIVIESGITKKAIVEGATSSEIAIRDGFIELIQKFICNEIPVMVASAGAGDIVRYKLEKELGSLDKVEIISNFLIYDENDVVIGASEPMIHSYNKYLIAEVGKSHFDKHKNRKNFIVFGDSKGDVDMIKTMPSDITSLKIGFVNFDPDIHVESYLKVFDIVLVNPSSLRELMPIFNYLLDADN